MFKKMGKASLKFEEEITVGKRARDERDKTESLFLEEVEEIFKIQCWQLEVSGSMRMESKKLP